MANLVRNPLTADNYQAFRGGYNRLSGQVEAELRGSCCEPEVIARKDRLPARMHFENALAHENPNGANQKWDFQKYAYKSEVIRHLNDHLAGAKVGVMALPTYALVTAFGISVGTLPEGFSFKLTSRNGTLDNVTGTLYKVSLTGELCSPNRALDTTANQDLASMVIPAPTGTDHVRTDYVFVPDKPIFLAQADEVTLAVETVATAGSVSQAEFDFVIGANYDVVIRAEA